MTSIESPPPLALPRARRGQGIGASLTARVRGDQALRLRIGGKSWSQVAKGAGYKSPSSARKAALKAASRADVEPEKREQWRDLTLRRYETLIERIWPAVENHDVKAIATARTILDSECRLLNLDVPGEGESMPGGGDLEAAIAYCTHMIDEHDADPDDLVQQVFPGTSPEFAGEMSRRLAELSVLKARLRRRQLERGNIVEAEVVEVVEDQPEGEQHEDQQAANG